ncbi:MAG: cytochrome c biogenesis protein CcsA, partial [Variovorax sp.]|nr:cytochrome c biogenesis protein CcsA [Variovorax sp.]
FVTAGFVLLSATLLAGWWFSETLYGAGKAWKWDHKTIFSVLSWIAFAVLLVGRAQLGWRGLKAVRMLYFGSALLLLAYVGSRFVLEVVLGRAA